MSGVLLPSGDREAPLGPPHCGCVAARRLADRAREGGGVVEEPVREVVAVGRYDETCASDAEFEEVALEVMGGALACCVGVEADDDLTVGGVDDGGSGVRVDEFGSEDAD